MKKISMPLAGLALCFAVACSNASNEQPDAVETAETTNEQRADSLNSGDKMEDDQEFMVAAASGGLLEVQLGEMAAQNASNARVKEFGQMMKGDHSKANEELKALAAQKNITVPSTPGEDHQEHINNLQGKKGAEFDRDYMRLMVEDHKEDIEEFEEAARTATDPDIKAFATKHVPILKQHLEQAQTISNGLKQ